MLDVVAVVVVKMEEVVEGVKVVGLGVNDGDAVDDAFVDDNIVVDDVVFVLDGYDDSVVSVV